MVLACRFFNHAYLYQNVMEWRAAYGVATQILLNVQGCIWLDGIAQRQSR